MNSQEIQTAVERFNYVIGTNNSTILYGFTDQTRLVETARAFLEMGSNLFKFDFTPQIFDKYQLPPRDDVHSLRDLAQNEPSVRAVFEMPFAFYLLWVKSFPEGTNAMWNNGLSRENEQSLYRQFYDLTCYLLQTFSGTGKRFYLGHWEGDWALLGTIDFGDITPTPAGIEGMILWLQTRQNAIEAARRDTPHHDVSVWNYATVNRVVSKMEGAPCVTNSVLPHVNVDYVGYSSYDALRAGNLEEALDYIESKMRPKPEIAGKRLFLDEFGFAQHDCGGAQAQAQKSRDVLKTALQWGCPFALYWQLYCNEKREDGSHKGFWLINDQNEKQPIYHTYRDFYQRAKTFVAEFAAQNDRVPTDAEFRLEAVQWLDPK